MLHSRGVNPGGDGALSLRYWAATIQTYSDVVRVARAPSGL